MINIRRSIFGSVALAVAGLTATGTLAALPAANAATTRPATVRDLSITAKTIDNSSAGHHYAWLVFRNTSHHTVTLRGYSGTSFVAYGNGTQVGNAALWLRHHEPTVVLKPGSKTRELVTMADPGVYGLGHTVKADGFRVYIPGSRAAVFVPYRTVVSTRHVNELSVEPIGVKI